MFFCSALQDHEVYWIQCLGSENTLKCEAVSFNLLSHLSFTIHIILYVVNDLRMKIRHHMVVRDGSSQESPYYDVLYYRSLNLIWHTSTFHGSTLPSGKTWSDKTLEWFCNNIVQPGARAYNLLLYVCVFVMIARSLFLMDEPRSFLANE